jgi:hypothetical protein
MHGKGCIFCVLACTALVWWSALSSGNSAPPELAERPASQEPAANVTFAFVEPSPPVHISTATERMVTVGQPPGITEALRTLLCAQTVLWSPPSDPNATCRDGSARLTTAAPTAAPLGAENVSGTAVVEGSVMKGFVVGHHQFAHLHFAAVNLCVSETQGLMQHRRRVGMVVAHDDWARTMVKISDVTPAPAATEFAGDVTAVVLPITYGTVNNLAHGFFRFAALRLLLAQRFGVPVDTPAAEWRQLTAGCHFVVLITGAKFGGAGTRFPSIYDQALLRDHVIFTRLRSGVGGTWSVALDPMSAGYMLPPRPETNVTMSDVRVCFRNATIGFPSLPMYMPKSKVQMSALTATAEGIVDSLGLRNVSWRHGGNATNRRRFCIIQRKQRVRQFTAIGRLVQDVQEALDNVSANASAAAAALSWDVQVVEFEALSMRKQAETVRQCFAVLGLHGAALTNVAFGERGSLFVDIQGPRQAGRRLTEGLDHAANINTAYGGLAHIAGVHHLAALLGDADVQPVQGNYRHDFNVEALPPRLLHALTRALRAIIA